MVYVIVHLAGSPHIYICVRVCVAHLVLLTTSFFVVVEDVLSDVFPAVVVGGDMVHAFLHPFVASPASVEENAQQQHWWKEMEQ